MIVDLNETRKEFINYTNEFDLNVIQIKRKQSHSLRVMDLSKEIANSLELDEEKVQIATLIGLLHDVGRFPQFTKYKTFSDEKSIDHGDLGEQILIKDMRKYIKSNKYDHIIRLAVKNHNKYEIESGLTKREQIFCKIIRDADKLDILNEATWYYWGDEIEKINNQKISKDAYEEFKQKIILKNRDGNEIDNILREIALVFDINYKKSFEILYENDYINKILDRFKFTNEKTRNDMEEIRKIANEYLKGKID